MAVLTHLQILEALPTSGPDAARAAVVVFSPTAHVHFTLDSYSSTSDLVAAIARVPGQPAGSRVHAGTPGARTQCFRSERGDRPDARNVGILVTRGDDEDLDMGRAAIQEALRLRNIGMFLLRVPSETLVEHRTKKVTVLKGSLKAPVLTPCFCSKPNYQE